MKRSRTLAMVLVATIAGCAPAGPPTVQPTAITEATEVAGAATEIPVSPTTQPSSASLLIAADLDGVMTTAERAHRLPLAVSIDDSRVARPQSGFNAASIVWHAPADGYEMRYLLVFQRGDASEIGPVRSTRNYSVHWAAELRAGLAHYGGDKVSRDWMGANNGKLFTDLEGMGRGNDAYHRISTRESPHNVYTSTAELWRLAQQLGAAPTITSSVHVRPFRDDSPAGDRGASQSITVPYRTVRVSYAYDPASNAYLRLLDGKPQIDPMDGMQVSARTVVVLYMTFRTDATIEQGYNRPVLGYIGTGRAQIFSEGRLVDGTWSKASAGEHTLILGPDGTELSLIRGPIFIQVVPRSTEVEVDP